MNDQNIASLRSAAPKSIKAEKKQAGSTSKPVYVRVTNGTALAQDINRAKSQKLATDGTGRASFSPSSMSALKNVTKQAAETLDARMLPGDVLDLGRCRTSPQSGYLCRRTASGDGYIVQSHEQAKSAPSSGMFFPSGTNHNAEITIDMMPITDVTQLPQPMYPILHTLARFVSRQPLSELMMVSS